MVVTKHFAIHTIDHLRQAKNYVENAEKTLVSNKNKHEHLDNLFPYMMDDHKTLSKQLVSGHLITNIFEASEEFIATKRLASIAEGRRYELDPVSKKMKLKLSSLETSRNGKKAVLAHHLIQSFSPDDELTPEEIHEIGRQTILEFTGGEYEFIIATHVDKAHIHNHIVFNTTNSITGKQFEWKVTKLKNGRVKDMSFDAFQKISDRIASKAGAKIIEKSPQSSRAKYTKWQTENIFKSKIKSRLDFLLEHSYDFEDFSKKAEALNLHLDFSGKWATYRLLDEPQVKNTRGRNLSKAAPEKYNLDPIIDHLKTNSGHFSVADVIEKYEEKSETAKNDFDYQVVIEPWQIDHVSSKGLYVNVDFGIDQHGVIFVGGYKTDLLDDGSYNLYLGKKDYFYFMDQEGAQNNRYMMGATLVKQLSLYNGTVPVEKDTVISKINELTDAINFLASHGVDQGGEQLTRLDAQLREAVAEAQNKLNILDDKIFKLQNLAKTVLLDDQPEQDETLEQVENQLEAAKISRNILKGKLDETISEINLYKNIIFSSKTKENQSKSSLKK